MVDMNIHDIPPDADLPEGRARRPAQAILDGLADIEGLRITEVRLGRDKWILDFHMPDQSEIPSSLVLDIGTGQLVEMTLRLGPVGDHPAVDRDEKHDIEGKWVDVLFDAADDAGVGGDGFVTGYRTDLGDAWAFESMRPHFRLEENQGGHGLAPREVVEFIEAVEERWRERFGMFEDRRFDPEFADNFIE